MRPITDLDHYEVLEVSPGASRDEVERAYRLALETYADDSLAGYSVFETGDAASLRERIEAAWRVLSDEAARRAYDGSRREDPPLDEPEPREEILTIEDLGAFDEADPEPVRDGAGLRRARMRRGLDLDDVSTFTKVNPTYLRFIEEERFAELPARVYVRGFVMAYASFVGLDARSVAADYLQRYDSR